MALTLTPLFSGCLAVETAATVLGSRHNRCYIIEEKKISSLPYLFSFKADAHKEVIALLEVMVVVRYPGSHLGLCMEFVVCSIFFT